MSELLPTLMLLFDGKSKEEIIRAITSYLEGRNATSWGLIAELEKQLNTVTMISYCVADLYDDIDHKNDYCDEDNLVIVCDDKIALDYIEGLREYRKMEYAYDYFQEAKDAMIEEMIAKGHIITESFYKDQNSNPYWGG